MQRTMRGSVVLVVAGVALAAGAALGQRGSALGDRPACVSADGQAIFDGLGYRHNVSVANHCTFAVDCHVFTDVSPVVHDIHLAAGASTAVPTFLSSPARAFVAHVDCPYEHAASPTPFDRPE